jgi:Tfp pilus assembly protein PilN
MNVRFNLASHPYENLRPRYMLAAMALVLVAVLSALLVARERQQSAETRSITQQMARFEQEMADLAREQRELDDWLRRPEVQEIRDHSAFLNSLILRKSLSWTQMFLDLERILPDRAQVTSIQPRINRLQQPELAISVTADDMAPLVELLKNLESSSQFGSPAVASQRYSTDRNQKSQVAMDLRTLYRQVLPDPDPDSDGPAAEDGTDAATDAGTVDETDEAENREAVSGPASPAPEALPDDEPSLARREGDL